MGEDEMSAAELRIRLQEAHLTIKRLNRRWQKADKRYRNGPNHRLLERYSKQRDHWENNYHKARKDALQQMTMRAAAQRQVRTLEHEKGQLRIKIKQLAKERDALLTTLGLKQSEEKGA